MGLKEKYLVAARKVGSSKKNVKGGFLKRCFQMAKLMGIVVALQIPVVIICGIKFKAENGVMFANFEEVWRTTAPSIYYFYLVLGVSGLVLATVLTLLSFKMSKRSKKSENDETELM